MTHKTSPTATPPTEPFSLVSAPDAAARRKVHNVIQLEQQRYRLQNAIDVMRETINRAYEDDLTTAEIAQALHTTPQAVRNLVGDVVRTAAITYPRKSS